jgi:signal transduction histidine kinase/DNA-binding NarL/FixJ family response regulator
VSIFSVSRFLNFRSRWHGAALSLRAAFQGGSVILGLCAIVVLWGGVGYTLSTERRQALNGSRQDTSNLARAFEEHITRSIKAVDQSLLNVRESYIKDPAGFDVSAWVMKTQFLTDLSLQISLIDKSGMLISSNLVPRGSHMDLSDREHFRVHRDSAGDELDISKPLLGRGSNKRSIQISRKIIGADGSFEGVVVVSVDPEYLSRFYGSFDIGADGIVVVAGVDGVVRTIATSGESTLGKILINRRLFAEHARVTSGSFDAVATSDGVFRIYTYRHVPSYPLIVMVGIAQSTALADYEVSRQSYASVAALLTLLLLTISVMIARHQVSLQHTREELRASELRYAQKSHLLEVTLEAMAQGLMMVDADGRVQVCNQRAIEKLDLPKELMASHPLFVEVCQWQWQQGEFGPDGDAVEPWLRDFVRAGGVSEFAQSYERKRPDGRVLEIRSSLVPSGGIVRTYTDITSRKELEAVLTAARDKADHAARAKSEFLAMMSHEIRSPMNGVLGIIELLRDTQLDAEQMHMVELVHGSATSLLGILNDILDFSKIEAGAVVMLPQPTAIRNFVQVIIERLAFSATQKGLQLRCRLADDLPDWLSIDPLRVCQILGNLLGNALKFTAFGTVELAVSCATSPSGPALVFAVSDTGIGMSSDGVHRLFEPFAQADASTTKTFGGTGLGLSISRRLAQMHGGDIEVTSVEGRGSVFTLTIPLVLTVPCDDAGDHETGAVDAGILRGVRVLVAEDQETNRWLLGRQLSRFGIVAELVEDGHQALAAMAERTFDLLLTDCHMPGMDGAELTSCIRAAETRNGGNRLPILGLTADVTAVLRETCLAAGMDDVAAKPINQRRLAAALVGILGRQHSSDKGPPAEMSAEPAKLFDASTYRELFADADEEGKEWIEGYLEAAIRLNERVCDSIACNDREALKANAHRLVGTSLSAGAMQIGMLARQLEGMAQQGTLCELRDLWSKMVATFDATQEEINHFLAVKPAPVQ